MSKPKKDKNKPNKLILWSFLAVFIVATIAGIFIYKGQKDKEKEITYNQLYQDIIEKKVEKIEMTIGGSSVKVKYFDTEEGEEKTTNVNSLQPFMEFVNEQLKENPDLKVDLKTPNGFVTFMENFVSFIPTILLIFSII